MIVAGSERYRVSHSAIHDLLCHSHDIPLFLPSGVLDAESKASPHPTSRTVFFILSGRVYSVQWSDLAEVARGDVQYARLVFALGGGP